MVFLQPFLRYMEHPQKNLPRQPDLIKNTPAPQSWHMRPAWKGALHEHIRTSGDLRAPPHWHNSSHSSRRASSPIDTNVHCTLAVLLARDSNYSNTWNIYFRILKKKMREKELHVTFKWPTSKWRSYQNLSPRDYYTAIVDHFCNVSNCDRNLAVCSNRTPV